MKSYPLPPYPGRRFTHTLKLEASPGLTFKEAAEDAQRLADQLHVCVEYDFNGICCNAVPHGDAQLLAQRTQAAIMSPPSRDPKFGRLMVFST